MKLLADPGKFPVFVLRNRRFSVFGQETLAPERPGRLQEGCLVPE